MPRSTSPSFTPSPYGMVDNGVAWQKQIRDLHLDEGTPPVPHLSVKKARVREVTRKLAHQIILKYEWLATMTNTTFHTGLFFGPFCAGVCCVGMNGSGVASTCSHRKFKISRSELSVLARGACVHWAPKGSNSKLVSWTIRLLQKRGVRVVIAFSDSEAGEVGTIYQACGWTYLGLVGQGKIAHVSKDGKVLSDRSIMQKAMKMGIQPLDLRAKLQATGEWRQFKQNPKGLYAVAVDRKDRELVELIASMGKPYPKRSAPEAQVAVRQPHQVGGDGSTPIPALQE